MKPQVLLVDDDPSICFTIKTIMGMADISFDYVNSGPEALDRLRQGFRGLILMDIMMPKMDGWETIRAMVDEDLLEGNVICMLTAVGMPGQELAGLNEYVVEYIRKPFAMNELVDTVREYLTLVPEHQT